MQSDRASELRARHRAAGSPPCAHADLAKEYYLGAQTGDYICTACGREFGSIAERDAAVQKDTT
ncbi:hypothetical protein [Dactylosporangium sp. NPDC050588]|uniref:hypothetical protein n=1 Tax=Dactylosporangium sp. NPDC050588 TaxID=3157211 RepID=UPI0033DDACCA